MDCSLPGSSVHGFSRKEYWSGLPFPSPGDLPDPGIKQQSPALQANSLPPDPPGKPCFSNFCLRVLFVYFPTLGLWLQAPSERSPGEGNSNPLQYSYLGNPKDREAWWATVQRVAKSGTRLSRPGLKDCLRHRKARHQLLYGRKWKIFFHVHFTCSPWPVWEAGSQILDLFCNRDLPTLVEMLSICSGADGSLPWCLRM